VQYTQGGSLLSCSVSGLNTKPGHCQWPGQPEAKSTIRSGLDRTVIDVSYRCTQFSIKMLGDIAVFLVVAALPSSLAVDNGLGRVPMMGWSTWCTDGPCFQDVCTQDEVREYVSSLSSLARFIGQLS
jgi:hypothetical protein